MSALRSLRGMRSHQRLLQPLARIATCQRSTLPAARAFTTSPWRRKDDAAARTVQRETKVEAPESLKPESIQKEKPVGPAKQPSLLAEQTVTNKEQRKADWAIVKDMAHYLWPKNDFGTRFRVGLSVALLVGAKVATLPFLITILSSVDSIVGPQCASSFLL